MCGLILTLGSTSGDSLQHAWYGVACLRRHDSFCNIHTTYNITKPYLISTWCQCSFQRGVTPSTRSGCVQNRSKFQTSALPAQGAYLLRMRLYPRRQIPVVQRSTKSIKPSLDLEFSKPHRSCISSKIRTDDSR